jgi:hypothetical protein
MQYGKFYATFCRDNPTTGRVIVKSSLLQMDCAGSLKKLVINMKKTFP